MKMNYFYYFLICHPEYNPQDLGEQRISTNSLKCKKIETWEERKFGATQTKVTKVNR